MIATTMACEPVKPPSHRESALAAIRVAAVALFSAVVMVFYGAVFILLLPWRGLRVRMSGSAGRLVGRTGLSMLGIDLQIDHPERLTHPAIYVCNHTSMLDVLLAGAISPDNVCFVARRGLLLLPFVGALYALSGHLLIPRARSGASVRALQKVVGFVQKASLGVFIWPEGSRTVDGRLSPRFKKGFVHMALDTGLPVVPLACVGAHRLLPKRGRLPRPGELRVKVLETVSTEGWRRGDAADHAEQVRALIDAALPVDQRSV